MAGNRTAGRRASTKTALQVFRAPDRRRTVRVGRPSIWGHKPDKSATPDEVFPLDDDALTVL